MGRSDPYLKQFWGSHIKPSGDVALLGFTDNDKFYGDLYDLQLENWDINSDWVLPRKYDTIICTRCAYFSKDLSSFFKKCHDSLKEGGSLYVDFGLGDHWRFQDYKIGWIKNGEQEHAYEEGNFLWSTVWDDQFLLSPHYQRFSSYVERYGYTDVKKAIFEEVPEVLHLTKLSNLFNIQFSLLSLWPDSPQLYVLIKATKV